MTIADTSSMAVQPSETTDAIGRRIIRWTGRVTVAAARLRHVVGTKWGAKGYMNMDKLRELTLARASTQLAPAAVA